ncbi:hypothetical protein DDE84_05980 [Bifidobacterium tibiigranuli]|uniref:Uncharacterized protein n=1 Tax=Bifidobacterium tibiigranuli TaxID=2172043 RepID=A0A5N6S519_9BIFI|nr:hypothetical protein [Bifidobacterium tibiigranuli]KAE8128431.1 hypothetical protein DDE84_05980 [Bifidobacterium tibiigranuli]KAE8128553.1 hypothetical protein DDF78_05365 [Bifidobacterium tibiigranuli]MCI1210741.1 hypothetical protein [Bifidobacterium tibiigranuli]
MRKEQRSQRIALIGRQMTNPVENAREHRVGGRLTGQCVIYAAAMELPSQYFSGQQCCFGFAFAHIGFDNQQTGLFHALCGIDRSTLHRSELCAGYGELPGEKFIGRLPGIIDFPRAGQIKASPRFASASCGVEPRYSNP